MRKIFLLLLSTLFLGGISVEAQVTPKPYWEKFSTANGLAGNTIQDVLIEGSSDIWIATSKGLSHFNGTAFTNYTPANSNLLSANILELELAQNKLWLITSSGLSSFDGTTFTNYTTSNGLLTNDIRGITSTSTDTLWMTSLSGTSKFDGINFIHYTSITGRDIESDSADNIYVLRYSVANNFTFAHLYDNGTWSTPSPTGGVVFSGNINPARLKKTANNELFITGTNAFHVKVSYPLYLERETVLVDNSVAQNGTVNLTVFEQFNGIRWIGAGAGTFPFIFGGQDSVYTRQYIADLNAKATCIGVSQTVLVVGSDSALYMSTPTIKKTQNRVPFSVNEISTSVRITDPLFSNLETASPNFEFPKNSGTHGIYSANFIVLAKKSNQFGFDLHPQNGYVPAFVPGPISSVGGMNDNFILKLTAQEIDDHRLDYSQANYITPQNILDWPAYGDTTLGVAKDLAPFVDVNANGCYDPENGDYPIIKGDEAIYWINHPNNNNLELEYHWMMYAYNIRGNASLNQSLFLQYTIINRATVTYDTMMVGLYIDGDLGNPTDDFVGTDSANNILYFYNGNPTDVSFGNSSGFGSNVPALGVRFLSDKLTNSIYYGIGSGVTGDPQTLAHWRAYLNSRWKNGQQLRYGGNGYNSSGVTANSTTHMYTGDPYLQTGWTELNPGGMQFSNVPGDRRMLGSIAPFSLQPNERKTIEIALGYGKGSSTSSVIGQNVPEMVTVLTDAYNYWNSIVLPGASYSTTDSCNVITSIETIDKVVRNSFNIYPIPTNGDLTVETEEVIAELQVIDMKGALVRVLQPNQKKFQVALGELQEGVYMLRARDLKNEWESKKIILTK